VLFYLNLKFEDILLSAGEGLKSLVQAQSLVQARLAQIPELIDKATQEAEEFFQQHRPIEQESATARKVTGDDISDSLSNFFVREKPRPEMSQMYEQVKKASDIWHQVKEKALFASSYQSSLEKFDQFFKKTLSEYGSSWDISNGVAYADLFFKPESAASSKPHQ
jgi:hypothetical protein